MKKNINLLIHEVQSLVAPSAKKSVRFKGSDVAQVTNKILVDQKAKPTPSPIQAYVKEEMKDYQELKPKNRQVEKLEENIKNRSEGKVNLDK